MSENSDEMEFKNVYVVSFGSVSGGEVEALKMTFVSDEEQLSKRDYSGLLNGLKERGKEGGIIHHFKNIIGIKIVEAGEKRFKVERFIVLLFELVRTGERLGFLFGQQVEGETILLGIWPFTALTIHSKEETETILDGLVRDGEGYGEINIID
ncbi:MAG: hypothetical protein ACTSYC_05200 [Promethearchaeota archaeon]